MRIGWVVAVAAALVMPGCLVLQEDEHFVSARKNLSVAEERAREWSAGTALSGIAGFEPGPSASQFAESEEELADFIRRVDESPGDGKAQAWLYLFQSESKDDRVFAVGVAANRTILRAEEGSLDDYEFGATQSISGSWKLDSNEAAQKADASSQKWRDLRKQTDVYGMTVLGQDEDEPDPVWVLMMVDVGGMMESGMGGMEDSHEGAENSSGASENESSFALLIVNANNGTVFDASSMGDIPFGGFTGFGSHGGVAESRTSSSGMVSASAPLVGHPVKVAEEGHPALILRLSVAQGTPGTVLNLTVKGPDGLQGGRDLSPAPGMAGAVKLAFSDPPEGNYQVEVRLKQGVAQSYQLTSCATATFSTGSDEACRL